MLNHAIIERELRGGEQRAKSIGNEEVSYTEE